MSDFQKIIKHFAMAFAIFLVISILTGLINAALVFTTVFNKTNDDNEANKIDINDNISVLNMEVYSVKVTIKEGDSFIAETNNKNININQNENKLYITQKKDFFNTKGHGELIIYIPSGLILDNIFIETGAGNINIENLTARTLDFQLGAGKIDINNLTVVNKAEIEGGVGDININNAYIKNLNLDMGAGKLNILGTILGISNIESALGAINLKLSGTSNDYTFKLNKGLGSINIDENSISNDTTYGTGNNFIEIDGGIGSTKINFIN